LPSQGRFLDPGSLFGLLTERRSAFLILAEAKSFASSRPPYTKTAHGRFYALWVVQDPPSPLDAPSCASGWAPPHDFSCWKNRSGVLILTEAKSFASSRTETENPPGRWVSWFLWVVQDSNLRPLA
jgi:hypothetical protein